MSRYSSGKSTKYNSKFNRRSTKYNEEEIKYSKISFYQGANTSINIKTHCFTNFIQNNDEYKEFIKSEFQNILANPNYLQENYNRKFIIDQDDQVIPGYSSFSRFSEILKENLSRKNAFDSEYISRIKRYAHKEKKGFQICVFDDDKNTRKILIFDVHHLLMEASRGKTGHKHLKKSPLITEYEKKKNFKFCLNELL